MEITVSMILYEALFSFGSLGEYLLNTFSKETTGSKVIL